MARKTHRPDDILWTFHCRRYRDCSVVKKTEVTLGAVLATKYPRKSLVKLFEEKLIHINGHKATPKDIISEGDEIWIAMAKEKSIMNQLRWIYISYMKMMISSLWISPLV